jgi:lipopolysaccharide/colanic/teichoic acid biosynthesis glycosyltransferase
MGEKKNTIPYSDGMNVFERAIKRLFDIVCSFFGILFLLPVFLFVYILIRCKDGAPVIFKQERIGRGGKPFYIFKYRTMSVAAADEEPFLVTNDDCRLTPLGRFLREYHLDELPQLWNVLKGDMSFVGPRPERKYFIDKIVQHNPDYEYLYLIRPGITSPATVYNGYTETFEKMLVRLDMDLEYLQKRSLLLDLKIIFTTVFSIIKGKKI